MIGRSTLQALTLATIIASPVRAAGGGFDHAITLSLPRVVKLYGAGAGLEAGYGTGVLVSPGGRIVTVYSLLVDARNLRAVAHDGTTYSADTLYRDRGRQLALLQLQPPDARGAENGATKLRLPFFDVTCNGADGSDDRKPDLLPGDWVVSAGNAFKVADGAEPMSIAHGVFSARTRLDARRRVKDFPYTGDVLVIDAITSNPGAPGSALVNLQGAFVGMIGREVISKQTHTHFNYAIPRDVIHAFLEEAAAAIEQGRSASRRVKEEDTPAVDPGIRLSRAGYRTVLPFVERVRRGSPAQRAGVRKDDLILSVNGRSISSAAEYDQRIKTVAPGEPFDLAIRRGRRILTVRIETEAP